ncbi:hypothetical protein FRB93_004792 [Tulasnella sp. JGI-2019a]|nr:hypothetical protein FRB93_004792 [Tulasnella sp. JGI-2019a]
MTGRPSLDEPLVFPSSPSPEPLSDAPPFGAPVDFLLDDSDDTPGPRGHGSNALDKEIASSSSIPLTGDKPFGDFMLDDGDVNVDTDATLNTNAFEFGESALLVDEDEDSLMEHEETLAPSPLEDFARRMAKEPSHRETETQDLLESFQNSLPKEYNYPPASSSSTSTSIMAGWSQPGPSVLARSFSGKTISFRRRARKEETVTSKLWPTDMSKLLEVPIHRLMDRLSATTAAKINTDFATADTTQPKTIASSMWVDKYRPKRFTDLVGDESVHRETLAWLKEWDQCVFKRKSNRSKKRSRAERDAAEGGEDQRAPDEYGRPFEKILLLAGPPGLGKTTLAHVVANQAGYSVLEINASDARTGNIIDERIKPALETGQGLGKKKPVLVVVDEVDGATGENNSSFVSRLVQLTIDSRRKRRAGEKRDPKDKRPLLRPIICICNDLYANSISKLRPICRIVRFNPAAPVQLTQRLRDICQNEGLQADTRGLSLLVNICKGDMRGCLNTLQMVHTRRQTATEQIVREATVGMKEAETTNQAVWNDIFIPMSKKRIKDLGLNDVEKGKYVSRLTRMIEATGAPDKIMAGCFSHYANVHQQDPSWDRSNKLHAWFGAFDMFSSAMRLEQEYAMLAYLPYLVAPVHALVCDAENSKVSRPTADWECHVKMKASEEIYRSLSMSVISDHGRHTASFRHLLGKEVVVAEFAPILNRIISPPLRPANSQVIKPAERAVLKKLVNVMVSLELRFVQERQEDGQMVYRLDPPIDIIVTYEGKRPVDMAVSKYAVRHMVAAEIESEYAARHADAVDKSQGKKVASFFGRNKRARLPQENEEEGDSELLIPIEEVPEEVGTGDALTRVVPETSASATKRGADKNKVDIADKPPVDFFGRPIIRKEPAKATVTKPIGDQDLGPVLKKFRVAYRFNEGSSAAVRKPVAMQSLL